MTRVLVVEAAGLLWGSERSLLNMLAVAPADSVAVCCPHGVPLVKELDRLGVRSILGLPTSLHKGPRWRRIVAAGSIWRACRDFQPDVLYLNQAGLFRTAKLATQFWNIPIVAHFRLFEEIDYLASQKELQRSVKGLLASSRAVEAEVRSRSSLAGVPLRQVYDPYLLTQDQGDLDRPLRIVCAGRVEPKKGQELLIEALAELEPADTPIECLFAGEGAPSYVDHLRAKAAGLKGIQVKWLGFVSDVPALLRSARVLAFPSERETFGRVMLEAWDSGAVPVVFAGSGGAAEIAACADAAIIYESQTPQALAKALNIALSMASGDRSAMATNGRSWIASNCQPDAFAVALSEVFAQAAASSPSN
jgi:glycosyltransferase involved in cell wall biosynthesis